MALATVVHPALAPSRRILAVSDIHGNRAFFRGLLEKAAFSSRDILVLVGDILEKGPDSLGLLRDILELSWRTNTWSLSTAVSPPWTAWRSWTPGTA